MSEPQKHFSDRMASPNSPIGPKRTQNDPKKAKIKKIRKQKSYEMKVIRLYE